MSDEPKRPRFNFRANAYLQLITDGKEPFLTQEAYASRLGVTRRTIARWDKRIDWDWVKVERRKAFARRMIPVDDAMFRAAAAGDVAAAKYVAERYDGYLPTERRVNINDATDEELRLRAQEIHDALAREAAARAGGQPPGYQPGAGTA